MSKMNEIEKLTNQILSKDFDEYVLGKLIHLYKQELVQSIEEWLDEELFTVKWNENSVGIDSRHCDNKEQFIELFKQKFTS